MTEQERKIFETINSPGWKELQRLAEEQITKLSDLLIDPKVQPFEQRIEDTINLRGTIKGLKWWINKANDIKTKEM